MIAKNYIKYPEALRFQCEMFSNGYKNSPRIMRLMTVIFEWTPEVPQWVKEAKHRMAQLVKGWKSHQKDLFETMKKKTRSAWVQLGLTLFPAKENTTSAEVQPMEITRILPECPANFRPILTVKLDQLKCNGVYRNFCNSCNKWATASGQNYEAYRY